MRSKEQRKTEYRAAKNAIVGEPDWRGIWRQQLWQIYQPAPETGLTPDSPFIVELGCGRAEFSLELARKNPTNFYLGIDLKSVRLWAATTVCEQENIANLFLMRRNINQLRDVFAPREIDQIWLTFPDPYPKKRHAERRMTGVSFLAQYREVLKPGGFLQFKTDNVDLFDFSLEQMAEAGVKIEAMTRDLHHSDLLNEETGAITTYERKFMAQGLPIHYLKAAF